MTDEAKRSLEATYLTTGQAADYLKLSCFCLEKMRSRGGGPRFRRHGRRVVYAVAELDAWSDARVMDTTADSDPNKGPARPEADARGTGIDGGDGKDG